MRAAQCVLKIVAAALALAAAVCCIIAFWDKIAGGFGCAKEKLGRARCRCGGGEYDDYVDWEEEA